MKRLMCVILMCLVIGGCSGIKVKYPDIPEKPVKTRTYNIDYDSVWNRSVEFFSSQNIGMDKMEKVSGLITTTHHIINDGDIWLYCGDIDTINPDRCLGGHDEFIKHGTINIFMARVTDTTTRVTVNIFGKTKTTVYSGYGFPLKSMDSKCYTNGVFEQSVLDYIGEAIE